MLKLILVLAIFTPTVAQGMGADPATAQLLEAGTNGGFFVLAMYWMRSDWDKSNARLVDVHKESMLRLERAYRQTEKALQE